MWKKQVNFLNVAIMSEFVSSSFQPSLVQEAKSSKECNNTINMEFEALQRNKPWKLVKLLEGKNPIHPLQNITQSSSYKGIFVTCVE